MFLKHAVKSFVGQSRFLGKFRGIGEIVIQVLYISLNFSKFDEFNFFLEKLEKFEKTYFSKRDSVTKMIWYAAMYQ